MLKLWQLKLKENVLSLNLFECDHYVIDKTWQEWNRDKLCEKLAEALVRESSLCTYLLSVAELDKFVLRESLIFEVGTLCTSNITKSFRARHWVISLAQRFRMLTRRKINYPWSKRTQALPGFRLILDVPSLGSRRSNQSIIKIIPWWNWRLEK